MSEIKGNISQAPIIQGEISKAQELKGNVYKTDLIHGFSPIITVSKIEGGHRLTITDVNGTKYVDVMDGVGGSGGSGENGKDGRGIVSVTRTNGNGAPGTTDTYTITYTDNTTSTFTVYNGKDGTNGTDGKNGADGKDGYTPIKGVDYFDGKDGKDGYTPVKGVDYFDGKDGENGINGTNGANGKTPYIQNGYWYIDGVNTNVKAQGVDGKDGADGEDGADGTNGKDGINGKDGTNGADGADGRGIKSIARTSGNGSAGTTDTYTITYTDNTTSTFTVYNGKDGTSAYAYAQEWGYSETEAEFSSLLANAVDKRKITLSLHTDGLIYLFIDGSPVGNGIALPSGGVSGDVVGNVDSANNIVLMGNLADGTYTVKYEMEDGSTVNIGTMVLDSNVYYAITKNLTNCSISNSATSIVEGESYSATISANDGYELKSVSVTMGGTNVSVTNGVINIASVTGNIVITAVAEEKAVEVEPTNFCVPLGEGWISGGRCSSTGADREDSESFALTNYIAVQNGDILSVQNLAVSTSTYSGLYKSDKTAVGGFTFPASGAKSGYVKDVSINGVQCQFTIDNANAGYIRICGTPSNVKNANGSKFEDKYDINNLGIVINIKRNGEWL